MNLLQTTTRASVMNKIENDRGEWVDAEGSPFSIARTKCQFPMLISDIEKVRDETPRYPDEYFSWMDVERELNIHKVTDKKIRENVYLIFGFEDIE